MSQGAKKAHQNRSRKTRDKLLQALEKLLRTKDFADIGVSEIAQAAGVSPASVYRRFDKKQGFIPVLFDLYLQRLNDWTKTSDAQLNIEGCTLREALALLLQVGWKQMQQQEHIMRAIYLHGRNHLALMGERGDLYENAVLDAMRAIIALYKSDIARSDDEKTARMLAYYLNNILLERGLFKNQTGAWTENISDADFILETADFAYGYLMTPDRNQMDR